MSTDITTTPDPWVAFISRAMADPTFDVAKLAALLDERRKEQADERRRTFNRAVADFQANVDPVLRDAINPHLRTRYTTLQATMAAIRPHMAAAGLNVRFVSEPPTYPGNLRLGVILGHECGYEDPPLFIECQVGATGSRGGAMAMTAPQALGATISYLRRYLVTLALNVVSGELDDDDGEAARHMPPPPPQKPANGDSRREAQEAWLQGLRVKLAQAQSAPGVDAIGESADVKAAMERAPQWVKDEVVAALSEALERVLGAVSVPGADKLGAG